MASKDKKLKTLRLLPDKPKPANTVLEPVVEQPIGVLEHQTWLTEEYLDALGYYKVSDDGKYGVYLNKHWKVSSLTYGNLPKDYRKIQFNRDKIGVLFGVKADWDTRHSINNACATSKEIFEIVLNAAI